MTTLRIVNAVPKRSFRLIVHIPSSVIDVEKSLLKKTLVSGLIARACSIFRVDIISIYKDPDSGRDSVLLVKKILEYLKTPHYLRRKLVPLDKDLRAVGVLPPLATPNQVSEEEIDRDHVREALVTRVEREKICFEAGLKNETCIRFSEAGLSRDLKIGDLVLVLVRDRKIVGIIDRGFLKQYYWVYDVATSNSLKESLERFRDSLVVVSTRKGSYLTQDLWNSILRDLKNRDLSIVFGSPDKDPDEIAEIEGWDLSRIAEYQVNTAPLQGVRSIRTYEALFITLSLFNNMLYLSKGI
ncbi:MAG: putative RNA uridine N3 methyltransferase [Sulfolobales archaeon]